MSATPLSILPHHEGAVFTRRAMNACGKMGSKLSGPKRCATTVRAINHNAFSKGDRSAMADLILFSEWLNSQYEIWLPVKDFPGYEVSSLGRLRSYWRLGMGATRPGQKGRRFTCLRLREPELRKPSVCKETGYLVCGLHKEGKQHPRRLHRLIAEAFSPNPGSRPMVNHLNGVRHDARAANLQWATAKENQQHASERGTMARGERHPNAKLNPDKVRDIRARHAAGESARSIAKSYGMNPINISSVVKRKLWRHVE